MEILCLLCARAVPRCNTHQIQCFSSSNLQLDNFIAVLSKRLQGRDSKKQDDRIENNAKETNVINKT